MDIYIGTSGWSYSWNEGGNLDWYFRNTGFNAVELNMSFYRFPSLKLVNSWKKYNLRWSVKVNRMITHVNRMKDLELWKKFEEIFSGLNVDFYLFQLPQSFKYNPENLERIKKFEEIVGEKMAVEFRDPEWYKRDLNLNCVVVSIDSPIGRYIKMSPQGIVYLRMHGTDNWYRYDYTDEELRDITKDVLALNPKKIYVFFNNDLWMLENGRKMMEILKKEYN
ncbi:hypothetical protein SUSAZ_08170 [Sulfolobus acidocaldarius SUSAZ]|nr:hypothetical protein SUSAZ_08170 [Sulfolobus acidocaldarius SUSAZ]